MDGARTVPVRSTSVASTTLECVPRRSPLVVAANRDGSRSSGCRKMRPGVAEGTASDVASRGHQAYNQPVKKPLKSLRVVAGVQRTALVWGVLFCLAAGVSKAAAAFAQAAELRADFLHPPPPARPWVYWVWLNGN